MSAFAWVMVAAVGGFAAVSRLVADEVISMHAPGRFPVATLAVNLAGTLALGFVAGAALSGEALVIVAGGGIGSFTTFSTWMLDSHRLAGADHLRLARLNLGISLVAGFAAVALGHWVGSLF